MRLSLERWCLLASACASLVRAASPAAPQVTAAVYPSTRTRVWSTTSSSTNIIMWINPRVETYVTILTVTVLEPGPVTSGPFPATVPQIAITSGTIHTTISSSGAAVRQTPPSETWVYTSTETWVVSPPEPTFLPASTRGDAVACEDAVACAKEEGGQGEGKGEAVCDKAGMRTGCLGQCEMRADGMWWCYRMWEREWGAEGGRLRMGRACWGEGLKFRQLNVPCVMGDVAVGCKPCTGRDISWGAVNWEG